MDQLARYQSRQTDIVAVRNAGRRDETRQSSRLITVPRSVVLSGEDRKKEGLIYRPSVEDLIAPLTGIRDTLQGFGTGARVIPNDRRRDRMRFLFRERVSQNSSLAIQNRE